MEYQGGCYSTDITATLNLSCRGEVVIPSRLSGTYVTYLGEFAAAHARCGNDAFSSFDVSEARIVVSAEYSPSGESQRLWFSVNGDFAAGTGGWFNGWGEYDSLGDPGDYAGNAYWVATQAALPVRLWYKFVASDDPPYGTEIPAYGPPYYEQHFFWAVELGSAFQIHVSTNIPAAWETSGNLPYSSGVLNTDDYWSANYPENRRIRMLASPGAWLQINSPGVGYSGAESRAYSLMQDANFSGFYDQGNGMHLTGGMQNLKAYQDNQNFAEGGGYCIASSSTTYEVSGVFRGPGDGNAIGKRIEFHDISNPEWAPIEVASSANGAYSEFAKVRYRHWNDQPFRHATGGDTPPFGALGLVFRYGSDAVWQSREGYNTLDERIGLYDPGQAARDLLSFTLSDYKFEDFTSVTGWAFSLGAGAITLDGGTNMKIVVSSEPWKVSKSDTWWIRWHPHLRMRIKGPIGDVTFTIDGHEYTVHIDAANTWEEHIIDMYCKDGGTYVEEGHSLPAHTHAGDGTYVWTSFSLAFSSDTVGTWYIDWLQTETPRDAQIHTIMPMEFIEDYTVAGVTHHFQRNLILETAGHEGIKHTWHRMSSPIAGALEHFPCVDKSTSIGGTSYSFADMDSLYTALTDWCDGKGIVTTQHNTGETEGWYANDQFLAAWIVPEIDIPSATGKVRGRIIVDRVWVDWGVCSDVCGETAFNIDFDKYYGGAFLGRIIDDTYAEGDRGVSGVTIHADLSGEEKATWASGLSGRHKGPPHGLPEATYDVHDSLLSETGIAATRRLTPIGGLGDVSAPGGLSTALDPMLYNHAVAHEDNGTINFTRRNPWDGSKWTVEVTSGASPALTLDWQGRPQIHYVSSDNVYVIVSSNDGTTWGTPTMAIAGYNLVAGKLTEERGILLVVKQVEDEQPYFLDCPRKADGTFDYTGTPELIVATTVIDLSISRDRATGTIRVVLTDASGVRFFDRTWDTATAQWQWTEVT